MDIRGDPFLETPASRFTFHHEGFRRLVADLLFARMSDRQGLALIEGPVGSGKTTVLVTLADDPNLSPVSLSIAGHGKLQPTRLMDLLCRSLKIPEESWTKGQSVAARIEVFGETIAQRKRHEGIFLLLVDRAESLPRETIQTMVMLSELRHGGRKLLHPVLTIDCDDDDDPLPLGFRGQEENVAFRYWLGPMGPSEVRTFIEHRMKAAGFEQEGIFTKDALAQVARISGGLPGRIVPLCHEALSTINAELDVEISAERVASTARYLGMDLGPDSTGALAAEEKDAGIAASETADGARTLSGPANLPPKEVWLDDVSVEELVPELSARLNGGAKRAGSSGDGNGASSEEPAMSSGLKRIKRRFRRRVAGRSRWWTKPAIAVAGLVAMVVVALGIMAPWNEPVAVRTALPPDQVGQLKEQLVQLSGRLRELEGEREKFQRTISAFQLGDIEKAVEEEQKDADEKSTDELVLALQKVLSDLGYNPGLIDGAFGSLTRQAIRNYQRDHALKVTGEPQRALLAHMTAFNRLKEASVRYDEKDFLGAVEAYDRVLTLQPNDPDARLFRGLAHLKLGDFTAGLEDFKGSATQEGVSANARYMRARIYFIQERLWELGFDPGRRDGEFGQLTARAIEAYQRVQGMALDPQPTRELLRHLETYRFHVKAVAAYREGDLEKAVEIYTLVLALTPDDAEAHFNRGLAFKKLGRFNMASQDYDNAIVLDPDMAKAYYDRANIHLMEGRFGQALKGYGEAILRWVGLG
jgi:MSHA biogenesis protein MshM